MQEDQPLDFPTIVKTYETGLKNGSVAHFEATIRTIDAVFKYTMKRSLTERQVPQDVIEHWYTRLAAALTNYFTRPRQEITEAEVDQITSRKQAIVYIFAASGYRSTKHITALMIGQASDDGGQLSKPMLILLLSLIGIDDASDEMVALAIQQDPRVLFHLMLGWLNQRAILTEQGERNRTALLSAHDRIRSLSIQENQFSKMVRCWMYCSYATSPKKHDIKETLNHLFVKRLDEIGLKTKPPVYRAKKRPRMLVVHERFVNKHAMFRCYAPYIRALKAHFYLVALADQTQIDESSQSMFDEIITLDTKKTPFNEIVVTATDVNPDIVFFPSVGMSLWTVLLANIRLASLQIAAQGHPATTRSQAIDFVVTPSPELPLDDLYSETVLTFDSLALFEPHSSLPHPLPTKNRHDDGAVHIAVNSKIMKLSYRLIEICKRLSREANQPIKFHFFPGEQGLHLDGLVAQIKTQLENATVYGYLNYPEFLQRIVNCDFAMAAFPFGNTNSTVDCCIVGTPCVVHFGPELPAQYDKAVLKSAEYPLSLVCESDEAYYSRCLELANNATYRSNIKDKLSLATTKSNLFSRQASGPEAHAQLFAEAYRDLTKTNAKRIP